MSRKKKVLVKTIILLLISAVLLSSVAMTTVFAAEKSGNCGENIKWSFSAGTLIIEGKGEMKNYNEVQFAPWKSFADQIKAIRISDGITSIGSLAFYECSKVKAIAIPDSIEKINEKAFMNCTSLRFADLSDNLKFIGKSAFYNCESMETLKLPNGLETIGEKAFYLCRSIRSVIIPESVKTMGNQTFCYCEELLRVEINAPITEIPEWCFYGCEKLAQIKLPSSVTEIGSYAFKKCDQLYTVSYSGNKEQTNSIRNQISEDVPNFENSGYVSAGDLEEETLSTEIKTDDKGVLLSQTNTSVRESNKVLLVSTVTYSKNGSEIGKCSVHFILTVNGDDAWQEAILMLRDELSRISDDYSLNGKFERLTLTLYMKNTSSVNKSFLNELYVRKIIVEVVDSGGSVWGADFSTEDAGQIENDVDFSYTLTEAPEKTGDKLGTDYSYEIDFDESSELNTHIVVALPEEVSNSTAFLYQQNVFGVLTRLQATLIDSKGNAHFYLSSVNKNSKYVIGINVPGEDTSDLIIPDESSDVYGAIARLEKINYAAAGERTMFGLTITEVVLLMLGLLVVLGIVVGVIMYYFNKNKQLIQKQKKAKSKR